jgi:hypothetical protein
VLIASADAALRAAGGRTGASYASSGCRIGSMVVWKGLLTSLVAPGETIWGSGPAALRPRTPRLNRGCGLSLDAARVRVPGGGANTGVDEGSGDGL